MTAIYICPLSILFVLWLILFYVPLSFSMFPPSLSTLKSFELADISSGQLLAAAGCYALGIGTVLVMVVAGHIRNGEVTTPIIPLRVHERTGFWASPESRTSCKGSN